MRGPLIVREARRLIGVPFVDRGHSIHGLDCDGLVWLVRSRAIGPCPLPSYLPRPGLRFILDSILPYAEKVARASALPGDVVLLKYGNKASHLGILTDRGVVHADNAAGCVVEADERARVWAAFRLVGA